MTEQLEMFPVSQITRAKKYFVVKSDKAKFVVLDNASGQSGLLEALYNCGIDYRDSEFYRAKSIDTQFYVDNGYVLLIPSPNILPDDIHDKYSAVKTKRKVEVLCEL